MKIEKIDIHHVAIKMQFPFTTSFSTHHDQHCVLVSVCSGGLTGWGECVVGNGPFYSGETISSAFMLLKEYLVPMVLGQDIQQPSDVVALIRRVRGNEMTKAGLENAVWDLFGRAQGRSLKDMIGGVRDRVSVGVSIGIHSTVPALLATVDGFVEAGYRRLKLKIKKGCEMEPLSAVRARYPNIPLMADANSDYQLSDAPLLKQLDALKLLMVEQPLPYYDIIDHAKLQAQMDTPICLDESIHRPDDVRHAIELKACRIINVKVGRVGGMTHALKIHEMTQAAGIPLWCGGMFETGVGRATNVALASLPNFKLPNDIMATNRYFKEDITQHFVLNKEDSTITVPTGPGLGVDVNAELLAKYRLQHWAAKA